MTDKRLPQIKTAVLVKDLVAAIERVRDAELKQNKLDLQAYETKRIEYVRKVKTHVAARLDKLTPDFRPKTRRFRSADVAEWLVEGLPEEPVSPTSEKCIRSKYDALISQLKMTSEDKVRLSPEDFRKFMTGDSSACAC